MVNSLGDEVGKDRFVDVGNRDIETRNLKVRHQRCQACNRVVSFQEGAEMQIIQLKLVDEQVGTQDHIQMIDARGNSNSFLNVNARITISENRIVKGGRTQ